MKSAVLLALVAITAGAPALRAAEQRPGPLPGYGCMMLKQTEAEAMDVNSPPVWIMAAPRPDAPRGTTAGMVVIAKTPTHVENGYVEVLQIDGAPGWIPERTVAPYHSASNPFARCEPTIAPNGRVGFR